MSVSDIVQEFNALPEGSKEFVSLIFELVTDANGGLDPELLQIVVDGARGYQSARDEILNRTRSDSTAILQHVSGICKQLRQIIFDGGILTSDEIWEFEFRAMQCSLILHNRYTGERSKIQYAMPIEAKPPKAKRKAAQ